jgi:glucose-6-phosphate isomerase
MTTVEDAPGSIRQSDEWALLASHAERLRGVHLRDMFADETGRASRMTVEACDLALDYSKHRVTDETMSLLLALAERAGLAAHRDAMFAGRHINVTEDRAAARGRRPRRGGGGPCGA